MKPLVNSLMDAWYQAWTPPTKITVSEWADAHRILSSEASAEAGRWITSRAPYQRGIMDAVNEPGVHTIVIMTSAQVGKTEALQNVLGYFIDHQPAPSLLLQPTLDMARAYSTDRLAPMIRDTPTLRNKMTNGGKAKSSDTILHKQFPGGHVTMAGANSPASLASRPVRLVLCDEVDRYPASAGPEGDPVSLAKKRTTTFWNWLLILTSTPTNQNSRINRAYAQTDQRKYFVPCPHCGHMQTIEWKRIIIPKTEDGDYDFANTHMACEQGCVIEQNKKAWMVSKGEWRSTVDKMVNKSNVGFHISELYSPWVKWSETAMDFIEKKGDPDTLKTFVNTSLGEVWYDKGETADITVEKLEQRVENYDKDTLPDDILFFTCAGDVQKDRVELLVQGWGENKQRWNVEQHIVWGDPVKEQRVWDEVDEFLKSKYLVDGKTYNIACSVIDSGGQEGVSDMVYGFCKPRQGRRVFAIKGSSEYYQPIVGKPKQVGSVRAMLYMVGGDTGKEWVLMNYITDPDYIHFPNWCDREFFEQLLGEERKSVFTRGVQRYIWSKTRERQEVLDLHVYNEAAYAILRPNIEALKAKRNRVDVAEDEAEEVPPTTRPQAIRKAKPKRNKRWMDR